MTKKLLNFVNENYSLYNAARKDTREYPENNGIASLSYEKGYTSKGAFERYEVYFHGDKSLYFDTKEQAEKALSKLGYSKDTSLSYYASASCSSVGYRNSLLNAEYKEKYQKTEEFNQSIFKARKQIRNNAKTFLFDNYPKKYVRFGEIPQSGKSYNFRDKFFEEGVSAYQAVCINKKYYIDISGNMFTYSGIQNSKAFEITGNILDVTGSDEEPLLSNAQIKKHINNKNIGTVDDFIIDVFNDVFVTKDKQEKRTSVITQIEEIKAAREHLPKQSKEKVTEKGVEL